MEQVSLQYIIRARNWLLINFILYTLMNGAQVFETTVLIPLWTAAPPDSLSLLNGKYPLDLKTFWIVMHSIHEVAFIISLIFCWKLSSIRKPLILLFVVHLGIRVWTLAYFAQVILKMQALPVAGGVDMDLLQEAASWRNWNYLRVAMYIGNSLVLLPLLQKLIRKEKNL